MPIILKLGTEYFTLFPPTWNVYFCHSGLPYGIFSKMLGSHLLQKIEFEIRALSFSNFFFSSSPIFGIKREKEMEDTIVFEANRIDLFSITIVSLNYTICLGFSLTKDYSVLLITYFYFFSFSLSHFFSCWWY